MVYLKVVALKELNSALLAAVVSLVVVAAAVLLVSSQCAVVLAFSLPGVAIPIP